jgi:general stress protein 26
MKIHAQSSAALTQLGKLIEAIPIAMLTNQDSEGTLVSRPMSPLEMDVNGALWFFTDVNSSKVEQLRKVNLSFADPARASYVSLAGHGVLEADPVHIKQLWSPFMKPWFPDGPDSVNLALLKVVPETAEYWDAPHSKMVRMAAMAASVVAGKPVGLGDHDTLAGLSPSTRAV